MEAGEIVTLSAILVTIFLGVVALLWQMRGLGSRMDTLELKLDTQVAGLREEIRTQSSKSDAQSEALRGELRAQNSTIDEVRLQQARLEGINSILGQDRHTHPPIPNPAT
jgi:hypothetical protein